MATGQIRVVSLADGNPSLHGADGFLGPLPFLIGTPRPVAYGLAGVPGAGTLA